MKFGKHDRFYDLESLRQIFMNAEYIPAQNKVVYYYLSDIEKVPISNPITQALIAIAFRKFFAYHPLINDDTTLEFYDLKTRQGLGKFIQTYGVTFPESLYDRSKINSAKQSWIFKQLAKSQTATWAQTVKETDKVYDPEKHGRLFSYNGINYDESMIAMILDRYTTFIAARPDDYASKNKDQGIPFSAEYIRNDLNDRLFDNIDNMTQTADQSATSIGRTTRTGYRMSGRYVDVARFNEKLAKVGLKRLLAYLGETIKEYEFDTEKPIESIADVIGLFIYNASDVINLPLVLMHKAYAVPYDLRSGLLERYPQVIYNNKPGSIIEPDTGNPLNVRRARLTLDSTSAKFVEKIVAPYNQLEDDECVNFLYPSKEMVEKIYEETGERVRQVDVLEMTKAWFEENVTRDPNHKAHKSFMQIYRFFDNIRGSNFNTGSTYRKKFPQHLSPYSDEEMNSEEMRADGKGRFNKTTHDIHKLLDELNTNICYYNKDGEETSGYATFLLGGIHGAEYFKALYDHDIDVVTKHNAFIDTIREQYPKVKDLITTKITKKGTPRNLFDADITIEFEGETYGKDDIKRVIKNLRITPKPDQLEKLGDDAYGTWAYKDLPVLWTRKKRQNSQYYKYELNKRYQYVSVGPANHEDFASYYPLLLSMISAFLNYARLDDDGKPVDTYYTLYQTRLKEKIRSGDKSLPEDVRILAGITQNLMKLLINAASGVGDSGFDNNLRVNNKIIKMRIIGQLFAYTIGQAQALGGARVVSTNTDGLYTMDISPEENDRILFETVKPMRIDIEPERLSMFVSKDTNNRMENHGKGVTTAGGGTLTSWRGPSMTNNLAHPAISDYVLAHYLNEEPDAPNHHFNRDKAREIIYRFIEEHRHTPEDRFELTRYFQWVMSSSHGSKRYLYQVDTDLDGNKTVKELQHYNRVFLVKEDYLRDCMDIARSTIRSTSKQDKKPAAPDPIAIKIHKAHGYDASINGQYATSIKVSGLKDTANTLVENMSLRHAMVSGKYGPYDADFIDDVLDIEAYLDYSEDAFENSWYNKQPHEWDWPFYMKRQKEALVTT